MGRSYQLGIDIGTTSTKAVLFDAYGNAHSRHTVPYPLYTPAPGAAEQAPDQIAQAVVTAIAQTLAQGAVTPRDRLGLTLSSAMHSLLAVDAAGQPLSPVYTWADQRAQPQATQYQPRAPHLYARTGVPLQPLSPLVKLLWLRATQPDLWQQAARFVSIKEYVLYRLCGEWAVDWAIAAASGLLNLTTLDWEPDALALAGLTPARLSPLGPPQQVLTLLPTWSRVWPLAAGVPVALGASDGVLSNLGLGVEPGRAIAVSLGTSGAARATVTRPYVATDLGLFCYPLRRDYWVLGGATNSGGLAWRWLRDHWFCLPADTGDEILNQWAATVPPGAEGLLFQPYLTGERAPLWDSQACGSFVGLRFAHGRAHAARAVLEGVLCNLALVIAATRTASQNSGPLWVTGGVWRSPLWRQTLADLSSSEVWAPAELEGACWGAARLGWEVLEGVATPGPPAQAGDRHQPDSERLALYQTLRQRYDRLLAALKLP